MGLCPSETIEYHFKSEAEREWPSVGHVKFVDRVTAELSADVVKLYYTGDPDTFKEVVKSCPVPLIVLSGLGAGNAEELLNLVHDVMDSEATGVIMGRNIWQYEDPAALMEAVMKIVHEDLNMENAKKIIE